jgi:hypothetical protein
MPPTYDSMHEFAAAMVSHAEALRDGADFESSVTER